MASMAIGSLNLTDGTSFTFATTGRYCDDCRQGGREREIEEIFSNGLDGGGTKDFGYRGQDITISLRYVDSTEQNIITAWNTDTSGLAAIGVTGVTHGTTDLGKCRIMGERCVLSQTRNAGLASRFHASAVLILRRVR